MENCYNKKLPHQGRHIPTWRDVMPEESWETRLICGWIEAPLLADGGVPLQQE